ncbi:MAG: biopolymer transporter ExbD [Burkholderiaceae bacterium]|jgi:biopolymer transport protein ExbD|uniref:ExbD/TolR family protein n=1 Tax=Polynucleobacter sp. MWH-Loch1C5 TaxID=2689108 RepID=UPI001C0B09A4|nr:biopolymer transporter ExbD [Polynucleobacter sp. MWH-Loch1C5]MBU3541901.1 biopolymer transporter ExbD [Polynucleobacter sp. MWH-Loch1C5]NBV00711.1 biopolymer transporter ExbD [Burkholderiaceae bacterium]
MSFSQEPLETEDSPPMAEINMTPLVDVMLVLLIIFMITLPVINHAVKVELPTASSQKNDVKPESINLSINAKGQIYWNNSVVDLNTLETYALAAAKKKPEPEVQLKADKNVRYEAVAQVLSTVKRAGLQRIGFVTEPQ